MARFQQLSRVAIKFLNKDAANELRRLCVEDEDYLTMFETIDTMKSLGLRNDRVRYDIEFPTRNHLKVFLTKLIMKRRRQIDRDMTDLASQTNTAVISSTDYCEDKIVSHLCKNIFTPRQGKEDVNLAVKLKRSRAE